MEFDTQQILMAFGLTVIAGMSTAIGSFLAFFTKHTNTKLMAGAMGFSAGVMLYVAMGELLWESKDSLTAAVGDSHGNALAVAFFFGGVVVSAVIDRLIPNFENPHEVHSVEEISDLQKHPHKRVPCHKLYRVGVFTAIAIAIHNFPEGFAVFASALKDIRLGIGIAIAIAIHNIPEGIAISIPIWCATKKRRKAFLWSAASGLAEPLGALLGFLILRPFLNEFVLGATFAVVAGIMVYISLDELLPTAQKFGEHHVSILGLFLGMAVMAISLLLI